jgi:hypothetical protein
MIRRSATNSDAIDVQINLGHLRLLVAFAAGVLVCFAIIHYQMKPSTTYDEDWREWDHSNYHYLPALTENEIEAIEKQFDKPALCQKTEEHPEGCAYVTLVTNDEHVELALVLHESLRESKSPYPLLVMVTDNLSSDGVDLLRQGGLKVKTVTEFPLPSLVQPWRDYWRSTYVKLRMWGFVEYERLVYLDADTLIMDNLDGLFQLHGEYLAATDRHLCKHEISPGMTSMLAVIWPSVESEEGLVKYINESGYSFARGDQAVSEMYFERRKSMTLLNESWASFVYRCQCEDYWEQIGASPNQTNILVPKLIHFTGWFRPHMSKLGPTIPAGLSARAAECAKGLYDYWEKMWRKAIDRQGLTTDDFMKKNVRRGGH